MKKIMLLFALTMSCLASFAGNMIIGGETKRVDTLMHRIIGPGVTYTKLSLPDYPLSAYLMTVNLANQYNKVETFQAQNRVGSTEAMTNAYQRLSSSRHNSLGSVNGNFWIVSGQGQPTELLGVSHSGSALDGQLLTDPNNWNRGRTSDPELLKQEIGFAVIDEVRKAWICDMGFDGKVLVGSQSFKISEVNRNRVTPGANEIVLFNQYLGKATRTSTAGTEVVVKLAGGQTWGVSKNVQCTVVSKNNTGGTVIAAGQAVLSGHGTGKTFLDNISVGQTITLNLGVYTLESGERPTVRQMVTGNAYVLRNGELTIRNTNEAYNSQLYPRTGIGASADGKKLFLIVIDKKGSSVGANTTTMCNILKAYGAYNVTSMDGGGSAQMMIGGAIVNNPSDGKERPVANGWMVFNTAPDDNVVASLLFEEHSDIIIPAYGEYK
ncbi:MAG TPA: phosphodiester glycosidase family protein, partial [Paludibacteraceae bacterium]|nr:phosphodiester glycosidase family protein [Paludibacteraceae bacterium]